MTLNTTIGNKAAAILLTTRDSPVLFSFSSDLNYNKHNVYTIYM